MVTDLLLNSFQELPLTYRHIAILIFICIPYKVGLAVDDIKDILDSAEVTRIVSKVYTYKFYLLLDYLVYLALNLD